MYQDLCDSIGFVSGCDNEVGEAMQSELARQRRNLELIASENIVSPAVLAAMGSVLTNKYAEGYPGKRYYGGCQCVDVVEEIARKRACELFGAEHANVQPHSGAQANMAVYFALLQPGDTVMGMNLSEGGHLTHGSPVNLSGKYYRFVSYGVDEVTHRIDYDKVYEMAMQEKPKIIVCGASAYPPHHRLQALPRNRRRLRRCSDGRHGPHRRTGRRRRIPTRWNGRRSSPPPPTKTPAVPAVV